MKRTGIFAAAVAGAVGATALVGGVGYTLAPAAFVVYQWVIGRRAVRAGENGDLEEFETGARRIVSV